MISDKNVHLYGFLIYYAWLRQFHVLDHSIYFPNYAKANKAFNKIFGEYFLSIFHERGNSYILIFCQNIDLIIIPIANDLKIENN
ncbi:hypothetical protein BpHYR1_031115 [Brachionus plicatilis]|uniref:Uncharacterized protein n=1 Tax=Brachionus plicatilis TaxID=10195 RepID=A0A3M7RRN6_BRAPC|nr:hypothetical protein BpHYR1_031115 [Brachionus plicatilis]